MNYKAVVQYEGTRYRGWQVQGNTQNTIQGKLEELLSRMEGNVVEVHGSGRTDAGVHAAGQVISFRCSGGKSCKEILEYMNRYLPADKCIREETGTAWKGCLKGQGLQPATVNTRISVWNSFLNFLGHREWQMEDFERKEGKAKPGLSRAEYLRLLSAAKQAGKERTYLLIKLFGGAGLRI